MSVSVTREGNVATIKMTAPAAEVKKSFAAAVRKLAMKVNVPGFRKGKAPRYILENYVGKEAVKEEAFSDLANKCYQEALDSEKLIPVDDPKLTESSFVENEDMTCTVTVTLKPVPELGQYVGLEVEKRVVEITDAKVDEAIEELRKRAAKMVATPDAIIEKGDFAIIDFAGTIDGEPFAGGESKGYPLEVGSESFIPGFEDQLVGLKAGESTEVEVTFPEDYFAHELAGKEAKFKVNVQDVKHRELPEVNDKFAQDNSEFKTLVELKADFKKRMIEGAELRAQEDYERSLVAKAVANAKVDIPEVMVEERINMMIEELKLRLEGQNMDLDMYLSYNGVDMAKLRANYRNAALENVRNDVVLDGIASKENLQVTAEEIDNEIDTISKQHGASPKEVRDIIKNNRNGGLLLANILRNKATRFIIDNAKVTAAESVPQAAPVATEEAADVKAE